MASRVGSVGNGSKREKTESPPGLPYPRKTSKLTTAMAKSMLFLDAIDPCNGLVCIVAMFSKVNERRLGEYATRLVGGNRISHRIYATLRIRLI